MRIIILGAGGMAGHKMWQKLSPQFKSTYAVLHSPKSVYARFGLFENNDRVFDRVDLTDPHQREELLGKVKPDVILNCAGITYRRREANDPIANIEMNALLPHQLAAWVKEHGGRVIHFSTDCVFEGDKDNYQETDEPGAKTLYGATKWLGEVKGPNCLTLRSSMIGRELLGKTELLEWFLSCQGKRVLGYKKAIFSGVTTNLMADIVSNIISNHTQMTGLYHIASAPISKYELLCLIRERFKLDIDVQPEEITGYKRNLIGTRFSKETGFVCPSWPELIDELVKEIPQYQKWQ